MEDKMVAGAFGHARNYGWDFVIYAGTARFICPDLPSVENANGKFGKVTSDLHLDILGSLEGF